MHNLLSTSFSGRCRNVAPKVTHSLCFHTSDEFPCCTVLLYFPHFVLSCPWAISYPSINISAERLPVGIRMDCCLKIDSTTWPRISVAVHLFLLSYTPSAFHTSIPQIAQNTSVFLAVFKRSNEYNF